MLMLLSPLLAAMVFAQPQPEGITGGSVVDDQGKPVAGARVVLSAPFLFDPIVVPALSWRPTARSSSWAGRCSTTVPRSPDSRKSLSIPGSNPTRNAPGSPSRKSSALPYEPRWRRVWGEQTDIQELYERDIR
jgi:hypothetical protein